jgi:hypothetical protein
MGRECSKYGVNMKCIKCLVVKTEWKRNRDSSVDTVIIYDSDDRESRVGLPKGVRHFFFLSKVSRPLLGSTQSIIQWVVIIISPGLEWPWPEACQLPPLSAQVNIVWSPTSTSQYAFKKEYSLKHKGKFTLNLTIRDYWGFLGVVGFMVLNRPLKKLDMVALTGLI